MLKKLIEHAKKHDIQLPFVQIDYQDYEYIVTVIYNNVTAVNSSSSLNAIELSSIDICNYLSI